jgi:RND family efflux transporter MFP subunit
MTGRQVFVNERLSNDLASLRISRDEKPPSSGWGRRLLAVGLVLGAVLAAGVWFWPRVEAKLFPMEVEVTTIMTVSPAQSSVQLTSTGYIVPQRVSRVGAKISGRIRVMNVSEGSEVKAGDVLAELEAEDHEAALRTAEARVLAAQAVVQTRQAELADIRQQAKRERSLVDQGVAGRAAAEDLEARAVTLEKQVKAAKASAKATQAEVESLEVNLGYLKVVAPMDGRVVNKPAQAGELVGVQAGTLVELADFSSLMAETDVPEARLHLVQKGGPCEIVLDAFPKRRLRGRVEEISPKVNRAKATVTVKVAFVDEPEGVLPEMAARVSFLSEPLDEESLKAAPKVVVPAAAIAERGGAKVVFTLEGGHVRMRNVTVGEPVGSGLELLDGPETGTKVVRGPADTLTDGQQVVEKDPPG